MSGFHKGPSGFMVDLENGWTVSVQFGIGNYCSNRSSKGNPFIDIPEFMDCPNAEIAAWPTDSRGEGMPTYTREWYTFEDGQEVQGWQNPTDVLEFLNKVSSFPSTSFTTTRVLTAKDVQVASKKWKPILKDWGIDY
jgi:hypothetical protein